MSGINIFIIDNENNIKEETNMKKPKQYQQLIDQLKNELNTNPEYFEIFIMDKNNQELKINNEENYKLIEDIIFIREIDEDMLRQTLFEKNYNKLSESKQEKLDQKYNCNICSEIIKNENPYLCYVCQKIFHEKCLKKWDEKCKSQNKNFECPDCRNELPLEKWNKKLDFEENRKDSANLMNKINEYKMSKNMNNNMNMIKGKKIDELKDYLNEKKELIFHYEKYIEKTIEIFKNLLNELNSIHSLLKLDDNNKLNNLINKFPLNIKNLNIEDISDVLNNGLKQIKNHIIKKNKVDNKKNSNKKNNGQLFNDNEIKLINKKINDNNIHNIDEGNLKERNPNSIKYEHKNKINIKYYVKVKGKYDIFGEEFVKNNKDNIELTINEDKHSLVNKCILKTGKNIITLKIKRKLTNLSYMFYWCKYLKDISELIYLNVGECNNFSYMFYNCQSLSDIKALESWNVSNGLNFEYMFYGCTSLYDIKSLQNWNVSNSFNFEYMFYGCTSLTDIKSLQNWKVSNDNDLEGMFGGCSLFLEIKPLEKWDISKDKLKNMIN